MNRFGHCMHFVAELARNQPAPTVLAIALAAVGSAEAQVLLSPALDEPAKIEPVEPSTAAGPTMFHLRPAAEPDPPLRYRLWPSVTTQRRDDAVPYITRALLMQYQAIHQNDASVRDFTAQYNRFSEASIDELPRDEVRAMLERYGEVALKELARAENRMGIAYDLGLNELSIQEAISTLLPEVQECRSLARLLHLRIRLAVAEQRWDDAVDDLRLGMRLAEFAGHSANLLVCRLVGVAIGGVMLHSVEEAIRQPDCPNLYWALATVPADWLFGTGEAIEFEIDLLGRFTGSHTELPRDRIGPHAARQRLLAMADSALAAIEPNRNDHDDLLRLGVGLFTVIAADAARDLLAETESWGPQAYELSMAEAVLRASVLKLARLRDAQRKWTLLPQSQWSEHRHKAEAVLRDAVSVRDPSTVVVGLLAPAVRAAKDAEQRVQQRLHVLITVEALRMHAAVHGELPESLEALDPVPAWHDPVTARPFEYRRSAPSSATLIRPPRWAGDEDTQLEIQLAP